MNKKRKLKSRNSKSNCISNEVLKIILFSQLARIERILNNPDSLMLATHNLVDTANNNYFLQIC